MKNRLKFFKSVPGILLIIAGLLAILATTLFISNRINNTREEKRIIAELEHKEYKKITHKDFRMLYKKTEQIDPSGELDKFVENGLVAWIVTQGHEKDSGSLKIVGRYSFDINGKAQFFNTTPRTTSVANLESWADRFGTKVNNLPADPEPPSQGVISVIKSGPGILALGILFIFAFFFLWFFLWGPQSKLGKFSRKQKKRAVQNKTTFADVAGVDEAKEELEDTIRLLKRVKQLKKFGFIGKRVSPRMRKGILLVGPPGTGKTLLARAVANAADVPFFEVTGSEFVEMYVGVGPARIRDLFDTAKKDPPAIIFVDEIDSIGQKRTVGFGTGGDNEYQYTTDALLSEMDGFDKDTRILVIGATNRPEVLDKALTRPGRFDLQIVVDLPDLAGRKAILGVHTKSLRLSNDVNLEIIAKQVPGFSGADLANLANEAHILADKRLGEENEEEAEITMDDLEKSIDKITYGGEKKTPMSNKDKYRFAAHEIGHLLTGHKQENKGGEPVHKISIVQRTRIGGHVKTLSDDSPVKTKGQFKARLALFAGGFVAEEMYCDGDVSTAASSDLRRMTNLAEYMIKKWGMGDREIFGARTFGRGPELRFLEGVGVDEDNFSQATAELIDEAVKQLTNEAVETAKRILTENKDRFEYIVKELLKSETIAGDELRKILEEPIPA